MNSSARAIASVSIENKIRSAVDSVVQQMASAFDEIAEAVVGRNTSTYLVINNSFFARDRQSIKTTQSSRRLVAKLSGAGKRVQADEIFVIDGETIKNHYKILSQVEVLKLTPITEAVGHELTQMGDLIFILVGLTKGLRPCVEIVEGASVRELRLIPTLHGSDIQRVERGVYGLKKIVPPEDLLALIGNDLEHDGGFSLEEKRAVADAYDCMVDKATTEVVVPTEAIDHPKETVLGKIVDSLQAQANEYRDAIKKLDECPDDPRVLNDVLRLAYNFNSDVLPLISLFRSICDLKPLIFWCSIKENWGLYKAFTSLPWSALGRKEKLEEYELIVSQARNHAFHHILPFDSTVEVDLSQLDVRAEKIRLFLPYKDKQNRGISLKDQKLADILAEFSRAKLRPVSNSFWRANLNVMLGASDMARQILESLILIHNARKS